MHTLVVRLDSVGDVLLTGPAVRAVASGSNQVTFLAGPRGRGAAELLPGVDDVVEFEAPWVVFDPPPVDQRAVTCLLDDLASRAIDGAVIFTSFHQSPLPTALLLRLAGIGRIGAISPDYPGSLLDVRHAVADDIHEVERALSLAAAVGFSLPPGDAGDLAVRPPNPAPVALPGSPVVVHPGAAVPARAWAPALHRQLVAELAARRVPVVVTGGRHERELTAYVASGHPDAIDLGGQTSLAELAAVLQGARAVVVGNTGPAHLAAAVGAPVVSLFAPTVPAARWRPWTTRGALLGDQHIACASCRARSCPVEGHPCIDSVTPAEVAEAVMQL